MSGWEGFLQAEVGASAALTGLIFVGISISFTKILSTPRFPNRALQALILLLTILVICSLLLVPGRPVMGYGVTVLVSGFLAWTAVTALDVNSVRKTEIQFRSVIIWNLFLNQVSLLPYMIAGIAVLTIGSKGFYWIVPGIIFSFIKAVLDAWILLIEIHR